MKKKIIFLSIFILLLAVGGVGIFYYTRTHQTHGALANEAKFKTYTAPAPTDGTTPVDHNSYDNIAYILWVLEHTDHYTSYTEGTAVSVGQTQEIYNHRVVNGDEQLVDTISSGLVSLGKQKYFLDDKVLIRDYISKKGDVIEWKTEEPECITKKEYINRYGWLPNQATAYIICKETILEISEITVLENGLYSITLSLNPDEDYAPFWYRREVDTNASSTTVPVFSSIIIEYIFNDSWQIQQVNTKEKYKVTPRVAPIPVNCETNIKETFDYSIAEFDASAMEFFEQYKDMVPVGASSPEDPEENTPLSYITGSLLGGDSKEKTFDVTINVNGQIIKGKLLLNISNLTSIVVKVSLGDLQVVYENNQVYIDYGSLKVKCDVDEISEVLQPLLAEIVMGSSSSSTSSEALDLNQIMNDLNKAQVVETENAVHLDLTLDLMGFNLPLVFDINKDGEKLDLQSIESNLLIEGTEVKISIDKNESLEFTPINGEYNDLKDIDFIVKDITSILKNKKLGVSFSSTYEDYTLSGIAKLGLNTNDPIQVELTIENKKLELNETVFITYDSSYFYVNYKEMKLKLSSLELMEFIKKYLPDNKEMPKLDISKVLETLSSIDFKAILQKLTIQDKEVYISLDLSSLVEELSIVDLRIEDTEEGFSLKTNLYDSIILLDTTTDFSIDFDGSDYVDMSEYLNLIDFITQNINKESLGIHIDGMVTYDTYEIGVSGDIELYLKDNAYNVEGNIVVTYLGQQVEVGILVLDKDVYVSLLGYTIKVNLDTISETLNEITRRLGVELPKMETPQIGIQDILSLLSKIKLDSNSIEADLSSIVEFIGVVGVSFSLEDTTLGLEIKNSLAQISASITPIEYKEIEVPTEYFDEKNLLNVIDYVEDVMTMINQQHGYISFSGKYEAIEVSGNVYIDWKDTLKAKGTIQVVYKGQTLTLDLIYTNETIYVAYENIKVKISETTIKELIQGKLPALPESKPEEILTKAVEVVKGLSITDDKISVLLNLGVFLEGMSETELVFTDTLAGFDITTNLYDLSLSLDVTKTEEIEVSDSEYSFVEGYIDLVEYLLSIINKESLGIHIDGTYYLESMPITFTGNLELMYNSNNSAYEVFMDLTIVVSDITAQVQLTYVEDRLYIQFYDTIIEISTNDFEEIISVVCEKFGLSFEQTETSIPVDTLIDLTKAIHLLDNSIEFNFSQFVSLFTNLVISYTKLDSGYEFRVNQENVLDVTISLDTIPYKEISVPQATLYKEDLYVLLDNVSYVLELVKGNAVHFEIVDANLDVTMNNQVESISINGSIDLLWNEEGYQIAGSLLVEGAGIVAQISVIIVDNTIYLTISNQTFCLKINEINDFITEAMDILSPMVRLDMPSMDNSDFEFNLKDLGFILTSESIGASLETFVGKACTLLVTFSLVENGLSTLVNVSYDELVQLEAPILISAKEVEEIHIPSNALSKDDLLEILTYVVEAYDLSLRDEFNLVISTSIHTNGEVVATIEGNVYIKLLENQEFDARLSLIVYEYKDNSQVGWHQLDVQVISLTTMNTLDPSVGMAMFYAIYGNNPDDLNAVVKVKSTYTGIEDLINTVLQLMNLDIPSLSSSSNTSSMDIRSLIDYIHVEKNSLSLGIEANFLFASMLDERQVMLITLTKNQDSKLEGIHADNIYVSYTNTMKYTKLDALDVTLEEGQMEFDVPSAETLQEYYDISEISNLFEALYHNALERTFSISGNIVLKAKVLITITESIPVKIKVGVEENGEPTVHVNIDMNNLKAGAMLASKKTVDVYYYKNYVYIQRTESSTVKRVKVHINEFMDNLVYYLLDFGMGLSDTILNAIDKPVEGDGFVDAAKCINSINIQKDTFEFGLNMGELTDNFNLEDLFISLGTSMVYQKNSDGSLSLVPMIHRINNFEFKMVKVITLSSTDLVLDNIDEEGIYNAVDVSFIESFTEEYNQTLDNEGNALQSDTIYEMHNGVWVKASSIEHKVTFDLATSNTKLENQTVAYAKDDVILPPSLDELLEVTLEDGTVKYYEFKGWYLDASYLTLANEEDWIMQDKNRTFYAKYQDITSTVTIVSLYHEDIILTSYIGFDISNYLSLYDLASADGKMYRFEGFSYEYDTIEEKEVILETIWNEVQFYLIDDQNSYLLSTEDSSSFLSNTYYVPVNVNIGSSTSTIIYYGYPGAVLTPSYILNMFSSSFVYNETTNHLELEVFQTISNAYASTMIDEGLGIMGYIPSSEIEAKGITLEQFTGYEINAWVDSYGNYYSWFDILAKSNQNVSYTDFYISTPQNALTFEINDTAKITGYTFDTSVTTLITPRYVYHDGKAVLVTVIGASAFFGAEETGTIFNKKTVYHHKLETIILHEGLVEIEANAFKNSIALKAVYLPSTLESVATDAFYMAVSSKAETNQDYANNVKFYVLPESTINVGGWLAYKWNTIEYNYNSNKVSNSSVEASRTVVESVYDVLSN